MELRRVGLAVALDDCHLMVSYRWWVREFSVQPRSSELRLLSALVARAEV
jgi:hypothetical protein